LRPAEAAEWDSLATVSLLTLVQEEFNIQIPAEDLESFSSFASAERYIAGRVSNA
jgi:acyl carrier protein